MITTKAQAEKLLADYIPRGHEFKFPGEIGLERTKALLKHLGDPQNKIRVIHLAGTSGKGSTAVFIHEVLKGLGFRVGLSVSPVLIDNFERFQINGQWISENKFVEYFNAVFASVKQIENEHGRPTHFEILAALTYYIFYKEQVDFAVVETGLGGLLDGTNVVTNPSKVAVITQIGLDHTAILGNTLEEIAFQKAGIIHPGNLVVTARQSSSVISVIEKQVDRVGATLSILEPGSVRVQTVVPYPKFDFEFEGSTIPNIELSMLGTFQIQNAALAIATICGLAKREALELDLDKIRASLKRAFFAGRMQVVKSGDKQVIFDGAHNPQKMQELVKNLELYYPDKKHVFVIAQKQGKDYPEILRMITPLAQKIFVTHFNPQTEKQGFVVKSEEVQNIAKIFEEISYKNYEVVEDSLQAYEAALKENSERVVVTGSLYLLSELYPQLKDLVMYNPSRS